jgi:DNA invertase Pin-like site-specific DNA recombinase
MKTALYVRVSYNQPDYDSQVDTLQQYCQNRGWKPTEIVCDHVDDSRSSRPHLRKLMDDVGSGKVERIVVFRIHCLSRSLAHLALLLDELQRHSVALVCTSQGIDTGSENPVGRLQLNALITIAEFEREIIRERVSAGIATAKQRGVKLGRPPKLHLRANEIRELKNQGLGLRRIARKLNMPISSVRAAQRPTDNYS